MRAASYSRLLFFRREFGGMWREEGAREFVKITFQRSVMRPSARILTRVKRMNDHPTSP